jgi:Uncharacterized protein conserved in bacteria (DUF2252)
MSFLEDNAAYEAWLRSQCDIVEDDLDLKYKRMGKSAFLFFRSTFFRWAKRIEKLCPALEDAPAVLAVGDAHLANFGTWRDVEGRLAWGINDFDDAAVMPYAFDLVRLCTSVRLTSGLAIKNAHAATAILEGYKSGLAAPRAAILDGREAWLRPFLAASDAERRKFWQDLDELPAARPDEAFRAAFEKALPRGAENLRFGAESKGGGSLGRPRFVVTADWQGGRIAREAKALVLSSWRWAHGKKTGKMYFLECAEGVHRAPDPFLAVQGQILVRRLSPDSRKLDMEQGVPAGLEALFLSAMAFDLASIHAAGDKTEQIVADLDERSKDWLHKAAKAATDDVKADFEVWKASRQATEAQPKV